MHALTPAVQTKAGTVTGAGGSATDTTFRYLGIPFAEPPIGDLRFAAPVPRTPWDGTRECTTYSATARQIEPPFTLIPEPVIPGDDCLTVNVFTPDPGAAGLPVLVWIHGGGFTNGSPASPWYDGRSFCRDGVVVVTVGYRLGAIGFLAIDGAPRNRGVLDWLLALEWVHDNIAAFGGDPANVTIGGQSAGGMACATLLAMPRADGLFRRAMLISGAASSVGTDEGARGFAAGFASRLEVAPTVAGFATMSTERILEVQQGSGGPARKTGGGPEGFITGLRGALRYGPIVDGDIVPVDPLDALRAGASRDRAVLVGATAEETNAMLRAIRSDAVEDGVALALSAGGIDASYRSSIAGPPVEVLAQAGTDFMFRVPAVRVAEARAAAGGEPAYLYDFTWQGPTMGAVHCIDVPFGFDVLDAEAVGAVAGDAPPQSLADEVHRAWLGFVRDGNAGWSRYDLAARSTMVFDVPSHVEGDWHHSARTAFEGVR